jgi:hypothetical protein
MDCREPVVESRKKFKRIVERAVLDPELGIVDQHSKFWLNLIGVNAQTPVELSRVIPGPAPNVAVHLEMHFAHELDRQRIRAPSACKPGKRCGDVVRLKLIQLFPGLDMPRY